MGNRKKSAQMRSGENSRLGMVLMLLWPLLVKMRSFSWNFLLCHGWSLAPENVHELVGNLDGVDCIDTSTFGDIVAVQFEKNIEKISKNGPNNKKTLKKF